ncbi:MAG: GNAT family N-acetyltransferase [Oscillospiraceae bacterium]|nr:GNAT family N-acetyltransferase [Oscillospiraceae bacterium]
MRFERYDTTEAFSNDVLEILLENEAQNNIPISIANSKSGDTSQWLLGSVKETNGNVVLIAAYTPPFNIVLFETGNRPNPEAVKLLSAELKSMGLVLPGVSAEQGLSQRFAESYAGSDGYYLHLSMNVMRLDKLNAIQKAPGSCRLLREDDLFYVPYWESAFGQEAQILTFDFPTIVKNLKESLDKENYFIWEDGHPVSQAVHARKTQNGAVVNHVFTPPHYRGKGYASSLVAELSRVLLERGNKFCCLFADANNPVSCGIYRKIGYYDVCNLSEIKFKDLSLALDA